MSKDIVLKQFEANSFGGISTDQPVIIDFTQARKNQGITKLSGDQGTKKTSTLNALMMMMGAAFNVDVKNFVNRKDDTVDVKHTFTYDGADYEAHLVGPRLTLKRFYKESGRFMPEGSPKETLRRIFGNLGVSPMFLKELDGKKQIQWFKDTFGTDEEATKKELKLEKDLKVATEQRKEVNRIVKSDKAWLDGNDMYSSYESNLKKFAEPIKADEEKKKLEALRGKKESFDKAKHGLQTLKDSAAHTENKISQLEKELISLRQSLTEEKARIEEGEKYIAANESITQDYQKANDAFLNISKKLVAQNEWKDVLKKEKEYNEALESQIQANATIDRLRSDLLKLTSTYLPAIDGLEIRTKGMSIDNEDEDEGIFYQGKSLAQLSESELIDLFLLIWEDKQVYFVFLENISSFGSYAIDTLNRLVKQKKAQVFASEMQRDKKDLTITFETAIK